VSIASGASLLKIPLVNLSAACRREVYQKSDHRQSGLHLQVLATSFGITQQLPKEIFINKIHWDAEKTSCNLKIFIA